MTTEQRHEIEYIFKSWAGKAAPEIIRSARRLVKTGAVKVSTADEYETLLADVACKGAL